MSADTIFPMPQKVERYECEISLDKLKLLHYLSPICDKSPQLPNYLKEYSYIIDELKSDGYFADADLKTFLEYRVSSTDLKAFLKSYNLSVTGKKEELITRIISNIDKSITCKHYNTDSYMALSEKGKMITLKYPKEFLRNAELDEIAYEYYKSITPNVLEQYPEFFEYKIKALEPYSEYGVAIKSFAIIKINDFPESTLLKIERDLKSEIFEKLYGVTVPNGIFYQVKRYFKSIYDLKSYTERNSNRISYEYTIRTANDERVCDFCKSMDGKKFIISDAVVGKNYPPFDNCKCEFCRCSARVKINIKH